MHTSLDSALGRQRRLNQIGETINSIAAPTAAYSLRSLTGGDPLAVRVRRQGTGEEDFTVSQINSGALVDYVNTNGVFANTGYESFSNASTSGFTASNTGSTGFAISDLPDGTSGTEISVSFDISITNGSPSISLRTNLTGSGTASNVISYSSSGSYTATLTANQNYVGIGFTEGDVPSNFTVSNFKILGNGFVETWYDQSDNGNDAVQIDTGKQPKIVSSGSLLTQGSRACINFDGSDDCLNKETYTQGALSQPNTAFAVAKLDAYTDSNRKIFDGDVNTARNMLQLNTAGNGQFAHFAGTVVATGEDADADRHLFTCLFNGAASRLRIDTTQKSTANAGTNTMNGIVIGANHDTLQNFWDGDIQEVIIFNSNQTSNFDALEGNINSYYSIL